MAVSDGYAILLDSALELPHPAGDYPRLYASLLEAGQQLAGDVHVMRCPDVLLPRDALTRMLSVLKKRAAEEYRGEIQELRVVGQRVSRDVAGTLRGQAQARWLARVCGVSVDPDLLLGWLRCLPAAPLRGQQSVTAAGVPGLLLEAGNARMFLASFSAKRYGRACGYALGEVIPAATQVSR